MSRIRRTAVVVAVFIGFSLGLTGPAVANKVYDHKDFSYGWSKITVCDRESDAEEASAEVVYGRDSHRDKIIDQDGAFRHCYSTDYGDVRKHRTCESNNWWPDSCGRWGAHEAGWG